MKKQNFWRRATAAFLLSIMVLTSAPAAVFAEEPLDLSDSGIITEVGEITDLTDEDIEFLPSGDEDDLPEISETPGQPEIPDPEPEDSEASEPESQPEIDPEARILAAMLDTGAQAIQQITTHKDYTYYHAFQQVEANWATATIGGELAYCVDMSNFHTNSGVNMGSSTTYTSLSADQKYVLGHIMQHGAKDDSNIPYHMATQVLIWEVVHGRMNLDTLEQTGSDIYDGVIGYNPSAAAYYDQILADVKEHEQVPSFMAHRETLAPTHKIPGKDGAYKLELTNENSGCFLGDFHFSSTGGVSFHQVNDELTVTASGELTSPVMITAYKGADGQTDSLLFWSSEDGTQQVRATPLNTNPVPAYMQLTTEDSGEPGEPEEPEPPEEEEYQIEIHKLEEGTEKPLAGAVFQIRHTEKGIVGNVTSDADGFASIIVPWSGSYIITEITPPEGHLLDENPMKDVVVNTDNPTASVTFTNKAFTGLRVLKVDASNSRPLSGAVIAIDQIDGDIHLEGTTDQNGEVFFEELPPNTSWEVTELQAPSGYHLNEKVFTAELEENQTVTVTIPDKVKPGLIIRKVDAETGEPLAGAVFTVTHSDGKLVGEYLSDANGMVVIENLPEGTYIIEEIQPPEGYLLDGENSKKTVNLSFENSQEVVFRDFAKPKLLIRKIDVDTGEPLEGAVIRVSRRGSSEYTEVTTGKDGTALLEGLEEDWYQVQEIRSPEGYILDSTVHDVELIAGQTATVVLTNSKEPGLTIKKVDAETGEPLPGAVFRVTMPNGSIKDVTTDENGIAHLIDLESGEIIVKEIRAPEGYLLDETEHHVRLESGKTAEITLKNSKEPSLTIRKIDSVTKQPMAGVKFSISVKNGKPLGEFLTDENGEIHLSGLECDLEAGTILVIKEISTLDGYLLDEAEKEVLLEADKATSVQFENQPLNPLLIKKVDQDGRPLAGVKFRVKRADGQYVGEYVTGISGLATVAGQQPGFFIVEEIETLPGYILDSTPKTVELRIDKPAEVEFINHKAGSLLIKKVNSVDGSALAGATFKVTTAEGTLVAEVTSNQNGYATLDNLEPGTYIVSEIKGPNGFILDTTPHTVVVKKSETATVEIANTPMSVLEIRKVDSVTGKPLSGITFEVEKLSGERIGTFVTDATGRIVIPDLTPQWVVVRETKTRQGYKLDPDPVNVEIKAGKTTVVKFENQPYPVLDLLKVDAETGKPMEGVKFRLLDSQEREIGTFTTNRNGRITLTGLDGGTTVYWQEVETLEGYELDETLHKVSLQWGKTSKITIENEKIYGRLEILKVAADGSALAKVDAGDSLAGAVFEIYNAKGKLVDRITTDSSGRATTKKLPVGEYTGKEATAPKFFLLNDQTFKFKIKKQDQLIKVTIKNDSKKPEVEIEKRGNVEAMPGQEMSYTLSDIRNNSNCSLDNFYIEDVLPTDAVRISEIHTGSFNEILNYRITYRTNMTGSYRVLADNLSTQVNHDISCAIPGLAANEYITAIRFEFGTVQEGFANEMNPVLDVNVLPNLPDGHRIQNSVTISGSCDGVPVYDKDYWVTVIVKMPDKPLPKTGIWE